MNYLDGQGAEFFCQVDSHSAVKDYQRRGRCIRFFGIEASYVPRRKALAELDAAIPSFTFDVGYWTFCRSRLGPNTWLTERARSLIDSELDEPFGWFCVKVTWDPSASDGYAYSTFSSEPPKFFRLDSATAVSSSPLVPAPPPHSGAAPVPLAFSASAPATCGTCDFTSYHVGQGMCSLVKNDKYGILLDLGAGIPVTRKIYLGNGTFQNDLFGDLSQLDVIDLVISHADADHWRILAWDGGIRKKIRRIYVPAGARSIPFNDPAVSSKVVGARNMTLPLSPSCEVKISRSKPTVKNSNSDCLVATFEGACGCVLAPGDYVYSLYKSDSEASVSSLLNKDFDAVIVPHHGDAASAHNIVTPRTGAKAFFSAGTHRYYRHPTQQSRDAHTNAGFIEVCDNTQTHILRHKLI